MPQRTKVVGARAPIIWLLIVIAVVVVAALAVGGLVIYPQLQKEQDAEQHYQAGVAFQNVEDWEAAETEFKQVITLDANYKDVQTRLTKVKARLAESEATATAVAIAQAEQVRVEAQATAVAVSTVTAEALETHYQKGLGYMKIGQWEKAKAELEHVFEAEPTYQDVQAKLVQVEAELKKLTPTHTSTPVKTSTPIATSTPMVTPTPVVHAYDDCSQEPGSTVCCCFVQYHVHDLGRVFGEGTEIRIVWQAGTPGGNCPGGKALFSVSTDMIAWTDIGQATVAPRQGFADIRHAEEFVAPVDFRFVKVDIPECYNDYSSAEVNY